jgi:hypothetical protein
MALPTTSWAGLCDVIIFCFVKRALNPSVPVLKQNLRQVQDNISWISAFHETNKKKKIETGIL